MYHSSSFVTKWWISQLRRY